MEREGGSGMEREIKWNYPIQAMMFLLEDIGHQMKISVLHVCYFSFSCWSGVLGDFPK